MSSRNQIWGIMLGASIVLVANLIIFYIIWFYISNIPYLTNSDTGGAEFLFGICIYQLLYVVPSVIWLKRQQYWGLMKGVIIGAVITAFLGGSCFLAILPDLLSL